MKIIIITDLLILIVGILWCIYRRDKKSKMDNRISGDYRHSHLEGKFPGKNYGD
jgi:hypothetical protein